jgi:signal transduction histidine kinase
MLAVSALFHYFTPQARILPLASLPLTRHTIERIIFLLPVAAAAFAFGYAGGLVVLLLAVLIMLPRVFLVSPQPLDALLETLAITLVALVIIWMIETQDKERKLRQRVLNELETVNAIGATLCQSLDLDVMLDTVLGRVLEVVGGLEPRGAIFLLDAWGQTLHLRAYRNLAAEFVQQAKVLSLDEYLCGQAAESGEVVIVPDALVHPRHRRCPEKEPHSHVCVPLKSKQRLQGVMDFHLQEKQSLDAIDRQLFAAIGTQIGVAVENARLYENLRFYVQQITRAQESERKRIARELHDDTAQGLIDLSRRIDAIGGQCEEISPSVMGGLELLQWRIEEMLREVRHFSRDLRPSVLDDLGLLPALEGLMTDIEEQGISPTLATEGEPRRLDSETELALYRITQEALNNVKRHAEASRVGITVHFEDDRVQLTVRDNGRGFEVLGSTRDLASMGRFGLVGMEERVQLLGGRFAVQAAPGEGTAVLVDVPAPRQSYLA